jgi:hypothetical protein
MAIESGSATTAIVKPSYRVAPQIGKTLAFGDSGEELGMVDVSGRRSVGHAVRDSEIS